MRRRMTVTAKERDWGGEERRRWGEERRGGEERVGFLTTPKNITSVSLSLTHTHSLFLSLFTHTHTLSLSLSLFFSHLNSEEKSLLCLLLSSSL
jgi:hypothetical protein